jgi:hypothetical protein
MRAGGDWAFAAVTVTTLVGEMTPVGVRPEEKPEVCYVESATVGVVDPGSGSAAPGVEADGFAAETDSAGDAALAVSVAVIETVAAAVMAAVVVCVETSAAAAEQDVFETAALEAVAV